MTASAGSSLRPMTDPYRRPDTAAPCPEHDPTFTHDHHWSVWVESTLRGHFFRVCLHPNCAAREEDVPVEAEDSASTLG